jgi:hypothetical protein
MNSGQFISQASSYRSAAAAPKTTVRRKGKTARRLLRKAWPTR